MTQHTALVVGAGIFGVTAALELQRRGWRVTMFDPGPIPHPLAASTDISKVIRMEYGPDPDYMWLVEKARNGWLTWNERWTYHGGAPLYHETGVLMLCREPMASGGFEWESYQLLRVRGHSPERMSPEETRNRFPAWNAAAYPDGFFHGKGGYAESGEVVRALAQWAAEEGVEIREGQAVDRLVEEGRRVVGVRDETGNQTLGEEVVVAAGVWTSGLVGLGIESIQPTGHPVFHLKPTDPGLFEADLFPTFTADVSRTGYYGFPLNRDGVVKIANHGIGTKLGADDPRAISPADETRLRSFLAGTFPALEHAEIVYTRLCMYADTQDENFWIARDPEREGLTVASGGSGHGFKFAPVLGSIIADTLEGVPHGLEQKFRWRPEMRMNYGTEAARAHRA